jgi:prepilin-type N-terminal cleavage/methylation domain-containing protein
MTYGRRGFTLNELLIVVVLGSLILAAALQVLITNQRTYTAQNAAITGQQSTRMALEVLFTELRQASPRGGDILMMSADSLRLRLMRKFGRVCAINTLLGVPHLTVTDIGNIDFLANDSVFIFADNNERDDDDDDWIPAQIGSPVVAGACPQDASLARVLPFTGQAPLFVADSVRIGAPVRSFTTVRFGMTTYSGASYLGRAEGSAALTPVAGPLRAGTGLEFVYRDSIGNVTTTPTNVRQIVVRVRSGSNVLNSLNQMVSDSVLAWVYTRN